MDVQHDKRQDPKDAIAIKNQLKEMGIEHYEPALVNLILDYAYKYVTDVLENAKMYAQHAQKRNIDLEDVKFVTQSFMNHEKLKPPALEVLDEIASIKNNTTLPPIKPYAGLRLPPDRYCLLSPNYQLKNLPKANAPNNINVHNFANIRPPYIGTNTGSGPLQQNIQYLSRTSAFQQRGLMQQRLNINLHPINSNVTNAPKINLIRQNQVIPPTYQMPNQNIGHPFINKNT